MSKIRRKLIFRCISAILIISSWSVLALSSVENIFGSHVPVIQILIGLGLLLLGSMILGLLNTNWPKALVVSFVALFCALISSVIWSIILSLVNKLFPTIYFSTATILASIEFITLVAVTELLTRTPFKSQVPPVLKSLVFSLVIVLILEIGRNVASFTTLINEHLTGLIIALYMFVIALDFTIIQELPQLRAKFSTTQLTVSLFVINLLAFILTTTFTRIT